MDIYSRPTCSGTCLTSMSVLAGQQFCRSCRVSMAWIFKKKECSHCCPRPSCRNSDVIACDVLVGLSSPVPFTEVYGAYARNGPFLWHIVKGLMQASSLQRDCT